MKLSEFWTSMKRNDGTDFCILTENAPKWLEAAVHEAHVGDLPNDWIHQECRDACIAIDEGLTDDGVHEHADGQVDIYTKDLARWYFDMCLTNTYSQAEEEATELGAIDGGPPSLNQRLMVIQYCAIANITRTILDAYSKVDTSQ